MLKITFEEFEKKQEETRLDYLLVTEKHRLDNGFRLWCGLGLLLFGLFLWIPGSFMSWRDAPMAMHFALAGVVVMLALYGFLGREKKFLLDETIRPYLEDFNAHQEVRSLLDQKEELVRAYANEVLGLKHTHVESEGSLVTLSLSDEAGPREASVMEAIGLLMPEGLVTYEEFLALDLAPDAAGEKDDPYLAEVTKEVVVSYTDQDNQRFLSQSDYVVPGDIWVKGQETNE